MKLCAKIMTYRALRISAPTKTDQMDEGDPQVVQVSSYPARDEGRYPRNHRLGGCRMVLAVLPHLDVRTSVRPSLK